MKVSLHRSAGRYIGNAQIVALTLDEQEDRNHLAIYTTRQYSDEPDESTIVPLSRVPLEGNEPRWTIEDRATRRKFHFTNHATSTKVVALGQGDRPYRGLFNSVNEGASNFEVYNQTHQELALQQGIANVALLHEINLGSASALRKTSRIALLLARETLDKIKSKDTEIEPRD